MPEQSPPTFTDDGFLCDNQLWTADLATKIATNLEITLTDEHWRVIHGVRRFYERTGRSLSMRPLVRVVRNEVAATLGNSIALARLFGSQTTRHVAMISGLPKPSDCI
ncbi:MAG: TusE/DsrC/DsvC family sulfur relay protein [Gammaproteobacteria bacterium]|nr:TusE/DsrC/DsvC family sulfur relay protein [Gammaproteobacteria bacterium]